MFTFPVSFLSAGGGSSVTYWNGVDTVLKDILNTQWGMNLTTATDDAASPFVNGECTLASFGYGYSIFVDDATGSAVTAGKKYMATDTAVAFMSNYITMASSGFVYGSSIGTWEGWTIYEYDLPAEALVSPPSIAIEITHSSVAAKVRFYDGNPLA